MTGPVNYEYSTTSLGIISLGFVVVVRSLVVVLGFCLVFFFFLFFFFFGFVFASDIWLYPRFLSVTSLGYW